LKFHPFNLRRRLIAQKYRKGEFQSVLRDAEGFLRKKPNDVFVLELKARAHTSLRHWEEGRKGYEKVVNINPEYLDAKLQLARCAVYTKEWSTINSIAEIDPDIFSRNPIQQALEKKLLSLSVIEFVDFAQLEEIKFKLPQNCLSRWANLSIEQRPNTLLPIDRYCLDKKVGGSYLGYIICKILEYSVNEARNTLDIFVQNYPLSSVSQWLSPGLREDNENSKRIVEWLLSYVNPREITLETLDALCINEKLPSHVKEIIIEYISHCSPEEVKNAIRVIGRKSDPREYVSDEIIQQMITDGVNVSENNPTIHTWMIEHCLRIQDPVLLRNMFASNNLGIIKPTMNSLSNLRKNRSDDRLVQLIELIWEQDYFFEEISMRQEISRTILEIAEPSLALMFAYECVQMEPQDAVNGLILLQAAIKTGHGDLILQAADIVLSMRHRSLKIDYASIAIAAVRQNNLSYAKNILKENRLAADTRSQRIRIGIPFHLEQDYDAVLDEIGNTQTTHLGDSAINIYKTLALLEKGLYVEAHENCSSNIGDETERQLLRHMIHRTEGQLDSAKKTLDEMLESQDREPLPPKFFEKNYDYFSLNQEAVQTPLCNKTEEELISIIMTVHKWNDAFPLAVNSILNQSHKNLELIVIDDESPQIDVERYDQLLIDDRIVRIRMEKNSGTYACRNKGIEVARGAFITFADSDDWNHPSRLQDGLKMMKQHNVDVIMGRFIRVDTNGKIQFNGSKLSQFCLVGLLIKASIIRDYNLRFDGRARYSADSEFFERLVAILGKGRVLRHSKIDIIALHHVNSLTGGGKNLIDWMGPGESRLRYVAGYRKAHEKISLGKNLDIEEFQPPVDELQSQHPNPLENRLRKLLGFELVDREQNHDENDASAINVIMATYPGGFATVGKSISSILNQSLNIDKLILHVNGTEKPPDLPSDKRLEVVLSKKNFADNGKFNYLKDLEGYFLTIDDDINYPYDYVETMISHLTMFNNEVIIGVHGAVLPTGPPLTRFSEYKESRRTHVFSKANAAYTQVNCLGTGTTIFHSKIGKPDINEFDTLRMVDLHLAVWAQKNQIKMYSCPRPENWLTEFEMDQGSRIWSQANEQIGLQWQMIETLNKTSYWKPLKQFPFELQHGLLSRFEQWGNRQLPPSMQLSMQKEWEPMSKNPKVTIYVPAFNSSKYIIECVDSALNQTYQNFEVSIQNGGTNDNTLELLEKHYANHPNVIVSSKPTKLGEGTNIAIEQGSGELILQLDSDDILHPDALAELVEAIGETNVCAYGNFHRIDQKGEYLDEGWEEAIYSRERLMRSMIIHHPRLFRRDAWEHVGRHDEDLRNAEDYDFFIKLSEVGNFVHLRKDLYAYRILENSASNFDSGLLTNNTHLVQRRMLERNNIRYEIIIDNPKMPRAIRYRHVAYSEMDD
jgi:glycosyltransferase involved in cell wall biosynthesis